MKKKISRLLIAMFFLLKMSVNFAQICNSNGNLIIYSNYDGGIITIDVDVNIPNLKVGICSYSCDSIIITGAFASNVTQLVFAGYNAPDNSCQFPDTIFSTVVQGVSPSNVSIISSPALIGYSPVHGNGYSLIECGSDCDTTTGGSGCNTPDELVYYFSQITGGTFRSHEIQYNCWEDTTFFVSNGGNCCILPSLSGFTSLDGSSGNRTVKLFPNPSEGLFFFDASFNYDYNLVVTDLFGKKLKSLTNSSSKFYLDLSKELPGVYICTLTYKNHKEFFKLFKQ